MIRISMLVALCLIASACASPRQARELSDQLSEASPSVHLIETPFIEQERYHCGPATLAMVARLFESSYTLDEITAMTFTPGANGTFKGDMLSASRRMGYAAYKVSDFQQMFTLLRQNRPVIVFQNLGIAWYKVWHFALLIGYDAHSDSVFLHSGRTPYMRMKSKEFVRTWENGGEWSYVILPAEHIPPFAPVQEAMDNAMVLGQLGQHQTAIQLYQSIIERWPERFEPYAGIANEYAALKQDRKAIENLIRAKNLNPGHHGLYHNLGVLYERVGELPRARKMFTRAEELKRTGSPAPSEVDLPSSRE